MEDHVDEMNSEAHYADETHRRLFQDAENIRRKKLVEELDELNEHLKTQGTSLRGLIDYVAKQAFGIIVTIPHPDTKAYLLEREKNS